VWSGVVWRSKVWQVWRGMVSWVAITVRSGALWQFRSGVVGSGSVRRDLAGQGTALKFNFVLGDNNGA
jgi:hypothetical protein